MLVLLPAVPARPAGTALLPSGAARRPSPHTYLFVSGFLHGGTSLVDLMLSTTPNATGLEDTHVAENEGAHLQHVWLALRDRRGTCDAWPETLCVSYFDGLKKSNAQRARG